MTDKFGWCLTADDDRCKTEVTSTLTQQTRRCSCDCHAQREETP